MKLLSNVHGDEGAGAFGGAVIDLSPAAASRLLWAAWKLREIDSEMQSTFGDGWQPSSTLCLDDYNSELFRIAEDDDPNAEIIEKLMDATDVLAVEAFDIPEDDEEGPVRCEGPTVVIAKTFVMWEWFVGDLQLSSDTVEFAKLQAIARGEDCAAVNEACNGSLY